MKTYSSTNSEETLQNIIQRITENLLIDQIYLHPFTIDGKRMNQLYVLLRNSAGQGITAARALCDLAVAEKPEYRCYVSLPEDVNRKIKQGNMRATLICRPDKLVFEHPEVDTRIHYPEVDYEAWYEQAKRHFDKEVSIIDAFSEGYAFYLNKANYGQAAFMLHQVIEQSYRAAENLVMGKEKISHSLRNHQAYIAPFCPELGALFKKQHELSVLGKLDESYSSARYDHDFSMSKEDLAVAANKGKELLAYLTAFNRDLLEEIQVRSESGIADAQYMPEDAAPEKNEGDVESGQNGPNPKAEIDHREHVLSAINQNFTPTHVFCFAHQSWEERSVNFVTLHNKEAKRHRYYLAILNEDRPDHALHKQHQINEVLGEEVEIVVLFFKLSTFNKKLREGHEFFHFLANSAEKWMGEERLLVQDSNPKVVEWEKRRWLWKRYFWKGEGLLKMTEAHLGCRYDECCSVLMSQAMEQLCLAMLYAFWGYRPDNVLNLMYLIKLTESITPLAPKCFCLDIPDEREMVVELSQALSEFRYNSNFDADGYSLQILHNRLLAFSSGVEKVVNQHFESLEVVNQ